MTRYALRTATVVAASFGGAPGAGPYAETAANPAAAFSSESVRSAQTRMLVVTGLGGEPGYARVFVEQGKACARHAEATGAEVTLLTDEAADREGIRREIENIAAKSSPSDMVIVQLIGHGTFDDEHYRFNVPGPDPTAEDIAAWLAPVTAKRQLAVIATSAGGAALGPLQHDGRAVITATRHGRERNASRFGGFWVQALDAPGADTDKDRRISADEAFRFAERAVADYYEDRQRIATEHPRLEGDAGRFIVARTEPEAAVEPALVRLASRVDELTAAIDALKADRRVLTEEDYFARLQELLVQLATVDREMRMHRRDSTEPEEPVPFREGGVR